MSDRRDFLIGGVCMAGLAMAEYLRPRRTVSLIGDAKLGALVPRAFGNWTAHDGGDMVIPKTEGTLADKLYTDQVSRTYRPARGDGPTIMLLIAYGAAQSDLLQLHRPESCYPAIGFRIAERRLEQLPLSAGARLPTVALTAVSDLRTEDIVYWARLGEYLPQTAGEQRDDRLRAAMQGYVGDGVLVRASAIRGAAAPMHGIINAFLADMVRAMAPEARKALIATERSRAMTRAV